MNTPTSAPAASAAPTARPDAPLFDMHCHLNRVEHSADIARELEQRGISVLCTTVTPEDAAAAQALFAAAPNVRVATGLHPWWVPSEGSAATDVIEHAAEHAAASAFVGEIGLDFSDAHIDSKETQLAAFDRIVCACAAHPLPRRVVSIHAVHAETEALDILERHNLPAQTACIFHWFSGTSDELARARGASCYFSVNERMLATKRGREYARQIPLDRLLLETDAPPEFDTPYSAQDLEASLTRTLTQLAEIRREGIDALASTIAATSRRLLAR